MSNNLEAVLAKQNMLAGLQCWPACNPCKNRRRDSDKFECVSRLKEAAIPQL